MLNLEKFLLKIKEYFSMIYRRKAILEKKETGFKNGRLLAA